MGRGAGVRTGAGSGDDGYTCPGPSGIDTGVPGGPVADVTGSGELWAIGDRAGVVPLPPDQYLGLMLSGWWSLPRSFGCTTARSSPAWNIVLPSPAIWCPPCALDRYHAERRCAYCRKEVRRSRALALLFEMDSIRVLGRAHEHCQQIAAKTGGGS